MSEWEIEERKGYVLLTLRGQGATTPLVVRGWTLDDLEILIRDVTSGGTADVPNVPEPVAADRNENGTGAAVAVVRTAAPGDAASGSGRSTAGVRRSGTGCPNPGGTPAAHPARGVASPPYVEDCGDPSRSWGFWQLPVILVLLQSAGIIDWSFLGPVALTVSNSA